MRLGDDDTTAAGDLAVLALAGFRRVGPDRWVDAEGEGNRATTTAAALRTARRDVVREQSAEGAERC